jgi:D-alanyl-D-alanine carboxypeptidase
MLRGSRIVTLVLVALVLVGAACSSTDDASDSGSESTTAEDATTDGSGCAVESVANGPEGDTVVAVVEDLAEQNDLTSVIYRVTRGDEVVASGAYGDTLTGIPADPSLRFRIGNIAFGYMGTLLLTYVDDGEASLDDPVSRWLPDADLPSADEVTLRMLVQNTTGYPDYVRNDSFVDTFLDDPFREFTPDQLLEIGFSTPVLYPPGTAWSYAHTNYVILGQALEAIGGDDLGNLITSRILEPLDLDDTAPALTPEVPAPVMHSYSTERGVFEETTFWNPSWQTAPGSVITSTICDMATSAEAVGSGELLDEASYRALLTPAPESLAEQPPSCQGCRQWDENTFYGLGVISSDGWVFQAPLFGGAGGVGAYLPSEDLTVAVLAVAGPGTEPNANVARSIWEALADELTPANLPTIPGS